MTPEVQVPPAEPIPALFDMRNFLVKVMTISSLMVMTIILKNVLDSIGLGLIMMTRQ